MRKTIKLFSLMATLALAMVSKSVWADAAATPAPTPVVSVGGLVDTYISTLFGGGAGTGAPIGNAIYNFDTAVNSYTLSLAEVSATAKMGEGSAHMTFAYGSTTSFLGLPYSNLLQAYVEWSTGNLTVDAGQFVTHMGQEVIESKSNWNYSRSLLFSYAIPYFHTGFRATYAFDPKFSAGAYVYDGWNSGFASDVSGGKTLGWMLMGVPDPSFTIMFNGIWGSLPSPLVYPSGVLSSAKRVVLEANGTWNATDKLSLAFDFNYGSDDSPAVGFNGDVWGGLALYARYQAVSDWAFALRAEGYQDQNSTTLPGYVSAATGGGIGTAVGGVSLMEETLTVEHTISTNLVCRLEGRLDTSANLTGTAAAPLIYNGQNNQVSATLGTVYSF
jgi:hypothetical protein